MMNIHSATGRVLAFERRFEAPRDVVYSLWTQPRHVIRWFGPRGHGLDHCEIDFREGGRWRVCMSNGVDGVWVWGTYREIVPPSRLVFSYSMDVHRNETLVTIDFEAEGEATLMRFRQAEFGSDMDCADHRGGWASALDRMVELILRLKGAGVLYHELGDAGRRDGVAADFAEAAARANAEREAGQMYRPPSVLQDRSS